MKKNKTIMRRAIALCLALTMLWTPSMAGAQDNSGEIGAKRRNVDLAIKMIGEAGSDVVKALEKVQDPSAAAGDPAPWRDLASQMDRYTQIVESNLTVIDDNMKIILELDPDADLPTITIKVPFAAMLAKVRERKGQIDKVRQELQDKIEGVKIQIAYINEKLYNAIEKGAVETFVTLGPSSTWDFVIEEGATAAAGIAAIAGLPVIGEIVVVALLIKKSVELYNRTDDAAKKIRALQVIRDGFFKLKRYYEELIKTLDPAYDEIVQIEAELLKHQTEITRLEQKLLGMSAGWHGRSKAFAELKKTVYKPPAAESADPVGTRPSMDYGAAIGESNAAWQDLLNNRIDGAAYVLRIVAAKEGAAMKRWENVEPYRKKYKAVMDEWTTAGAALDAEWPAIAQLIADEDKDPKNWGWSPEDGAYRNTRTPGIMAFYDHKKKGEDLSNSFRARRDEVGAAARVAEDKENILYEECIKTIDTERAAREKDEGANLATFYELHKKWESFEFTRRYSEDGAFGQEVNIKTPLSRIGGSGESLGWAAWEGTFRFPGVLASMKQSPVAGPLKGAKERFAAWQKDMKDAASSMREIFSWARSQANTASGLASEADGMASRAAARVEAWQFLRSYADYMDMREALTLLKSYKPLYDMLSEVNRAQAESSLKEAEKFADDVSKAATAMAQAPSVLATASRVVTYRDKAVDVRMNNDIGESGGLVGTLSESYGINYQMLKELESMIAGFASPEKLEAHILSILPARAYGSGRNKVLTKSEIEDIRKQLRSQAAKIARDRDDYTEAYSQMAGADKELDGELASLKTTLGPILPAQLKFLSKQSVLGEVASGGIRGAYLPDPKDFPDLLEGAENILAKYIDLSEKYYALVTPMIERLKKEPLREIKSLETLAKRVDEEGPGWLTLEGSKFTEKWNEISSAAHKILTSRSDVPSTPDSALNKAYFNVMTKMNVLHDQFYQKSIINKIPELVTEVRAQIDAAKKFLEAPEENGGTREANSLRQKLEALIAPGSDAYSLKANPQMGPLVDEASGMIEKLKAPIEPKKLIDPLSFYKLIDARVNGNNLKSASGIAVFTNSDLKGNAIEFTARLNTIERIEKLLISADDGRVWNELPLGQAITYQFTPMPNKLYQIAVKIKGTDMEELAIRPFENIQGIQYQNVDYQQLVVDVMKKFAEAYENENVALVADIISRDFLGNRTFLEEGVRFDCDMFDNIRLQIFIDRIQVRNGNYVTDTHWIKSQIPKKTGQQQRTSGYTTMTFVLEDGKMKMQNLRGDLIYATLSPEIAESSGLSQTVVEEIAIAQQERIPVQPGAGQTEESGGVSGVAAIPVRNGSCFDNESFDLEAGTQVMGLAGGDFSEIPGMPAAHNIQPTVPASFQATSQSFGSLNTAPAGGYADVGTFAATTGTVLLFRTRSRFYGKMRVTSEAAASITFEYAVQTDGSTNIRTQ